MVDAQLIQRFERIENLIDGRTTLCARQFESIDDRFDTLEGKVDSFARRMDDEVEQRSANALRS